MSQHATTYTWLKEFDLTNRLVMSHWTTTRSLPGLQHVLMLQHAQTSTLVRSWIWRTVQYCPELSGEVWRQALFACTVTGGYRLVQCRFTSTETIRNISDRDPRPATSTFTRLLSSVGRLHHSLVYTDVGQELELKNCQSCNSGKQSGLIVVTLNI